MTNETAPEDKAHRELGNTIREFVSTNDSTLVAYEAIAAAAYAVIEDARANGLKTVSEAAFNEANELLHTMYDAIREHKVTSRKVCEALDKVTY